MRDRQPHTHLTCGFCLQPKIIRTLRPTCGICTCPAGSYAMHYRDTITERGTFDTHL